MSLTPELRSLLDIIIEKQEGGWVLHGSNTDDDPDGDWTYAGVTAKLWEKYHRKDVSKLEFQEFLATNIGRSAIEFIYEEEFISSLKLSKFPALLQGPLLSCAINRGVSNAVKALQLSINDALEGSSAHFGDLKIDGNAGPKTWQAFNYVVGNDDEKLKERFLYHWTLQYINLVQENAEAWRDRAVYLFEIGNTGKSKVNYHKEPSVLRATHLEGWFNRVEFWR